MLGGLFKALGGGGSASAALQGHALGMLANHHTNQQNQGQWGELRDRIPDLEDLDFGQYADFPELQQLLEAERAQSAFEEGGGEGFDARMRALSQLEGVADTGETARAAADRAAFESETGMRDRAGREAILSREQEMAGGNNTGRRLADQLLVSQGGADRRAMGDLNTQAQLEGSRMNALQGIGQMGAGLTGDTQRSQQARDMINQFNLQRQDQRDFSNNSIANQTLLGRDQRGMQNLDLRNAQQQANNQQRQQTFQNHANVTAGSTGQNANFGNSMQQGGQFAASQQQQNNQFQQQQNMAQNQQHMGMAAGAAAAMGISDKNAKKNIKQDDFDTQDFLDKITGFKYEYKDPFKHGSGERLGVMAQDLQGSKAGNQIVKPTEDGLAIDSTAAVSPILASLGQINERLKEAGL